MFLPAGRSAGSALGEAFFKRAAGQLRRPLAPPVHLVKYPAKTGGAFPFCNRQISLLPQNRVMISA
jgi:hypothetical protein